MLYFVAFVTLVRITTAATLSSSPTPPVLNPTTRGATTTAPPIPPFYNGDLRRKRQEFNNPNSCGTAGLQVNACQNVNSVCAATILPNSQAYQYCSAGDLGNQVVFTTAIADWPSNKACPSFEGTWCCSGSGSGAVQTNLFIASGYTVTGFGCAAFETTITWNPYTNLLDPSRFSASLASLPPSSAAANGAANNPTDNSTPTDPNNTTSNSGSGGGLSSAAKAGIGAGVIVLALLCGVAFVCWRRREKKKQRVPEVSALQPPHHNPPMEYSQAHYYQNNEMSPSWSPQPASVNPKVSELATVYAIETSHHELPGNGYGGTGR